MSGVFTKIEDDWTRVTTPAVNVDGVFRPCKKVYVRVSGKWHTVWQHTADIITLPRNWRDTKELHDVRTCAA